MIASRRQVNAVAAFIVVNQIKPIEEAGALAVEMLTLCGYDTSGLLTERVDRCKPVLYTDHDENAGGHDAPDQHHDPGP